MVSTLWISRVIGQRHLLRPGRKHQFRHLVGEIAGAEEEAGERGQHDEERKHRHQRGERDVAGDRPAVVREETPIGVEGDVEGSSHRAVRTPGILNCALPRAFSTSPRALASCGWIGHCEPPMPSPQLTAFFIRAAPLTFALAVVERLHRRQICGARRRSVHLSGRPLRDGVAHPCLDRGRQPRAVAGERA